MANGITFRVQTRSGVVERTVQPGGVLDVQPGEQVLAAWSDAPVGGLLALAQQALVLHGGVLHTEQERHDGLPRYNLLYNFANVAPMGAPVGPFGFVCWQTGPARGPDNEATINGTTCEDLLTLVRMRIEGYQTGPVPSPENDVALDGIERALAALASRTSARQAHGVEGTDAPHVPSGA